MRRGRRWAELHLPFGVRLVVGLLLMMGGVLAFLPVFGLWMLPLGIAIAAIDVIVIWNWSLRQVRRYRPRRRRPPRE